MGFFHQEDGAQGMEQRRGAECGWLQVIRDHQQSLATRQECVDRVTRLQAAIASWGQKKIGGCQHGASSGNSEEIQEAMPTAPDGDAKAEVRGSSSGETRLPGHGCFGCISHSFSNEHIGQTVIPTFMQAECHRMRRIWAMGRVERLPQPVQVPEQRVSASGPASALPDAAWESERVSKNRLKCQGTVVVGEEPLVRFCPPTDVGRMSCDCSLFRSFSSGGWRWHSHGIDSSCITTAHMGASLSGVPQQFQVADSPYCPTHLTVTVNILVVGASSNADAGRVVVFPGSSGHRKRLRVVGHFVSQTTTVPAPLESLTNVEFDMTACQVGTRHSCDVGSPSRRTRGLIKNLRSSNGTLERPFVVRVAQSISSRKEEEARRAWRPNDAFVLRGDTNSQPTMDHCVCSFGRLRFR